MAENEEVWDDAAIINAFQTGISLHNKSSQHVTSHSSPWYKRDIEPVRSTQSQEINLSTTANSGTVVEEESARWQTISFDRESTSSAQDDASKNQPNHTKEPTPAHGENVNQHTWKPAEDHTTSKGHETHSNQHSRPHSHCHPGMPPSFEQYSYSNQQQGTQTHNHPGLPPTLQSSLASMEEAELSKMLWAWYSAGYQTGRYQALRELRTQHHQT